MTRLLSALLGALLGCALLWLLTGGQRVQAHPLAADPTVNGGRLQLHGDVILGPGGDGWWQLRVQAVCDTGTGMLFYLIRDKNETKRLQVRTVPNGCQKAQAER